MTVTGYVTLPEYQCLGKRAYDSKSDAKRAARRGEWLHGRLQPYRCPHCDRFHIGHPPRLRSKP